MLVPLNLEKTVNFKHQQLRLSDSAKVQTSSDTHCNPGDEHMANIKWHSDKKDNIARGSWQKRNLIRDIHSWTTG